MAERRAPTKLPGSLAMRRPLLPDDEFYELSICPCEEESIQPPIETYTIPGEKVQYEKPDNPAIFEDASRSADSLLHQDITRATQMPSDDDFSDTEPTEAEMADDENDEDDAYKIQLADLEIAVPGLCHRGLQYGPSYAHNNIIPEPTKKLPTQYFCLPSTSTQSSAVIKDPHTDSKSSCDTLDEEPQLLLEELNTEFIEGREPNGYVELKLLGTEDFEKSTEEEANEYYEALATALNPPAPPGRNENFIEMINWTIPREDRILPKCQWGPQIRPIELNGESYIELVSSLENILRRLLITLNYDSISNFMQFHNYFTNYPEHSSLYEIYQSFQPVIYRPNSTCVGLTLELLRRWRCLRFEFPELIWAMAPLSCEESAAGVTNDADFTKGPYQLSVPDKEHLMAGVHFHLHGRPGLLLADPGYHVARIITVMADEQYPHTGRLKQVTEQGVHKVYEYTFNKSNNAYVIWREEDIKATVIKISKALIYADRPFCDGIRFAEKRNLVYKFKSLVRRAHTGLTLAGMSFCLSPVFSKARLTIFFHDQENELKKIRKKMLFRRFLNRFSLSSKIKQCLDICNRQLNFPKNKLLEMICELAKILSNEGFVRSCMQLNYYIQECSS